MEAAVVSGILKIVSNKLAPLLIKEYSLIVGVQKHLVELKDQIQEINCWLEAVGDKVSPNTPAFNCIRKLKDIAYDVDDIVDEFQLKAEEHDARGVGGVVSRYMCKKTKSLILQCKAASKLKAVKKRFDAIVKQRTEFNAIANSLLADHPARDMSQTTANQTTLPTVDVASVLGRDKEKHQIISKLIDDKHTTKTISIIGLGGSGKTTLAKLVFNDCSIVEKHFEVRLWVHVSQEFDVDKLIKKLFEAFADNNPGQHALPYMIKTISDKLTGKRLLLVLDDVWTEFQIQWEKFMVHLKSSAPGSRILLTARSRRVAETVRSIDQFDLPFLSLDDSWQLFQQSLVIPAEGLESEFVNVGKEIVNKCGGVPLAIKAIAGVLNGMEQIQEWKSIRDSNVLDVEGKECIVSACLRLSYLNLPSHLKQCFTICSLFPKGHNIDKEQLIDLWIAHDMITVQDPFDYLNLEYVGHKHFNSLLEVSFLQNVEEKDGRVTCRMHDLVHDLALSILGDEISHDMPTEATRSTTKSYRYFSLIKCPEHMAPKNVFRKARAVYMPKYEDYIYATALKHAKHLRSVTVGYLNAEGASTISQVKYLKYLAVSELGCETLPKTISDVWSLQALHVTNSFSFVEITESIGKLKMLRTLNLSGCRMLKSLPDSVGDCHMISSIDLSNCNKITVLPDSIGKLQKLRTLNLSWCIELKCLPDTIGDCKMISSIGLRYCIGLIMLPDSIGKLQKLRTLNLSRCRELKCLPDTIGDCKMISSIDVCNCEKLTVLPGSIGRNEKLRFLRLRNTKIERLPSSITKLRNLECLDLQDCSKLVELPEGIGNLDKLQVLNLKYCTKLGGMPISIGQLSRLQQLGLFAIGKGEKFAGPSELANVSRFGDELTIIGIQHVMDTNGAHVVCLKQKTNLQRLHLQWMSDNMEEVNTELQQDVLNGLEPPPGIKMLHISGYSGRQYAGWMQRQVGGGVQGPSPFPFLREMWLCDLQNLKHLDGLVELPCLEELGLLQMPSLESISGGPFPSLVNLQMDFLPCLGQVWIVTERTMPGVEDGGGCYNLTPHLGQFRVGSCLTKLEIDGCPKLEVMPHLPPSLQQLDLRGSEQLLQSPGQCQGSSLFPTFFHLRKLKLRNVKGLGCGHGWELLQHLAALESLEIISFTGVQTKLPESLLSLTSLRSLEVRHWSNIHMLPESIGKLPSLQELTIYMCNSLTSLPQSMGQLSSLQLLTIRSCHALQQLPDWMGELCSLRKLEITDLPELTCLPQSICRLTTSLQELKINACTGLTSFPLGMEGLVSLENLSIYDCTGLTSLPQGMKGLVSLENLMVWNCPGIKSLPEGIKGLAAMKKLVIISCPDLERRCEREKGEDWHLISHILWVRIR